MLGTLVTEKYRGKPLTLRNPRTPPWRPPRKIYAQFLCLFFSGSDWELARPLQTPNFQSSWKWQKIGEKVPKSYFLSLFHQFWPILGSAVFFCPVEGRVVLKTLIANRPSTIPELTPCVVPHFKQSLALLTFSLLVSEDFWTFLDFSGDHDIFSTFVGGYKNNAIAEKKREENQEILTN